jgi:hypothetical protein
MEKLELPKFFSEQELSVELGKNPKEIDYDYVLRRAGSREAMWRVYHVAEYELRHIPGGEEKWRQAISEYYSTHDPDSDGEWWKVTRLNELMGSPLKLGPLPDWDKVPPRRD